MESDNYEINLIELFNVLIDKIWVILSMSLFFLLIGYIIANHFINAQYKSEASVMVLVENERTGEYDYSDASRLLDSVAELMTMDIVLDKVNQTLELNLESHQLDAIRANLDVTSSQTAYFIDVAYTSTDRVLAKNIVNTLIDETITMTSDENQIPFLMNKIKRVSYANDGAYVSPNKFLYMIASLCIGDILLVGAILVLYFSKNTIKHKDEILREYDLPVLGEVPAYTSRRDTTC